MSLVMRQRVEERVRGAPCGGRSHEPFVRLAAMSACAGVARGGSGNAERLRGGIRRGVAAVGGGASLRFSWFA